MWADGIVVDWFVGAGLARVCAETVALVSAGLRPVESRRRGRSRYGGMAGQGTGVGKRERARGACT